MNTLNDLKPGDKVSVLSLGNVGCIKPITRRTKTLLVLGNGNAEEKFNAETGDEIAADDEGGFKSIRIPTEGDLEFLRQRAERAKSNSRQVTTEDELANEIVSNFQDSDALAELGMEKLEELKAWLTREGLWH